MTLRHGPRTIVALFMLMATGSASAGPVPSDPEQGWWKGNLHTHSFWSDGNDFPEMIADWYRENGYHFLAISDHNVLSRGERWMPIAEIDRRSRGVALEKYIQRWGESWVQTRGAGDSLEVRLRPFYEYRSLFEERGAFLMMEAEEITDNFQRIPVHLNAANLAEYIPPQRGENIREVMRNNLVAIDRQAEEQRRAILGFMNHPNFGYALTAEDMAHVTEMRFFEVFNGHTGVNNSGDRFRPGLDEMWDIICAIRIAELGSPPPYGLATDDAHNYHGHSAVSIVGRGWVMVRSTHLTPESLIRAIEAGDFYASTGVELREVGYDADYAELFVEIEPVPGESYTIEFIGTREGVDLTGEPRTNDDGEPIRTTMRYSEQVGEVFERVEGTSATYRLRGDDLYVRARITSSAPPERATRDSTNKRAWTQPVGWERRIERRSGSD